MSSDLVAGLMVGVFIGFSLGGVAWVLLGDKLLNRNRGNR
jgi:F0F1-type ATP synthase assembly protein I